MLPPNATGMILSRSCAAEIGTVISEPPLAVGAAHVSVFPLAGAAAGVRGHPGRPAVGCDRRGTHSERLNASTC